MRFTWTKRTTDTKAAEPEMAGAQAAVAGRQFVAKDFVKLLGYAVASGIAFSALAIGVTLAVSRDSEAQTSAARWVAQDGVFVLAEEVSAPTAEEVVTAGANDEGAFEAESEFAPAPGSLYIGDGCGAEELVALEREWHVLVDGNVAIVQVMQTFVLPDDAELQFVGDVEISAPFFSALLPRGAEFLDMKVDLSRARLQGVLRGVEENGELDYRITFHKAREAQMRGELTAYLHQGGIAPVLSTMPLFDLRDGENIVVTYRYRIGIEQANGRAQLTLPLQALPEADDDNGLLEAIAHTVSGMVWVEWKDPRDVPRVFDAMPFGVAIEQSRSGIVGLNWSAERIAPGEKFVLGWR